MFYVYIMRSEVREYWYVGLTNDLKKRFLRHQAGKNRTTSVYKPFKLIYSEQYDCRTKARAREKYLKSGCGKEWLKKNYR